MFSVGLEYSKLENLLSVSLFYTGTASMYRIVISLMLYFGFALFYL